MSMKNAASRLFGFHGFQLSMLSQCRQIILVDNKVWCKQKGAKQGEVLNL